MTPDVRFHIRATDLRVLPSGSYALTVELTPVRSPHADPPAAAPPRPDLAVPPGDGREGGAE